MRGKGKTVNTVLRSWIPRSYANVRYLLQTLAKSEIHRYVLTMNVFGLIGEGIITLAHNPEVVGSNPTPAIC